MSDNPKADLLDLLEQAKKLSNALLGTNQPERVNDIATKLNDILPSLINNIKDDKINLNYYAVFEEFIKKINDNCYELVSGYINFRDKGEEYIGDAKAFIIINSEELIETIEFFEQLGYFDKNIVIVGANGSGKTFLANKFKKIISNKTGVVLPAQKILIIPSFKSILNPSTTKESLDKLYKEEIGSRTTYDTSKEDSIPYNYMHSSGSEFRVLLENLLSENNELVHTRDSLRKLGKDVDYSEKSKLDKAFEIWNFLIEHRTIKCDNGRNIKLEGNDEIKPYDIYQMSDGEKVVLYDIAHVIQVPENGFIIVDEPEMFLHKTIMNKLWDKLEHERQDCLFIYLTHDLDFASSRVSANKRWIKSFTYNGSRVAYQTSHKWELVPLEKNNIPEELLMKLLGSRKKILFCEGTESSIDNQVYEILFPNLTIEPVSSCKDVISYTKAYNKLPNKNYTALGIIDKDFREDTQLKALTNKKIYSFEVAEIENLFLDKTFLNLFAEKYDHNWSLVNEIENEVMKKLSKEKEMQISFYVSSKINHRFSESHTDKGKTISETKANFNDFTKDIDIDKWYNDREKDIEKIINDKNYDEAIKVFNNKGLNCIVNKHFKIGDYRDKALLFLQKNPEAQEILRKYFPDILAES